MGIQQSIINNLVKVRMFESEDKVENNKANSLLLKLHKTLLSKVNLIPKDYEVGFLWNLQDYSYYLIKGSKNHICIKDAYLVSLLKTAPNRSLVFIHNHPSGSSFSDKDIKSFAMRDSLYAATVVCENGVIYMLRKDYPDSCKMLQVVIANYNKPGISRCSINGRPVQFFGSIKDTVLENSSLLGLTYRVSK